ncbi:hypothetical protein ACEN85_19630, partial [Curtobacterium sp. CT11-45]
MAISGRFVALLAVAIVPTVLLGTGWAGAAWAGVVVLAALLDVLLAAAKAWAWLTGYDAITPDHVQAML